MRKELLDQICKPKAVVAEVEAVEEAKPKAKPKARTRMLDTNPNKPRFESLGDPDE